MSSRFAEKLRNTEPWCAALLYGPSIEEDTLKGQYQRAIDLFSSLYASDHPGFHMLWSPGFAIKYLVKNPFDAYGEPYTHVLTFRKKPDLPGRCRVGFCNGNGFEYAYGFFEEPYSRTISDIRISTEAVSWAKCIKHALPNGEDPLKRAERLLEAQCSMLSAQAEYTFALLNCRNIKLEELKNPPKKRSKGRDKRQVDSYWVLNIPGSSRYWEKPAGESAGTHSRLHVVRGHFKTYTEEAPLFGRVVGTVWCPSHARGNAELGLVDKDYCLTEKKAEAN